MSKNERLLGYMQAGANKLLEQEVFDNGWAFKTTQGEAIRAYANFLADERLPIKERLEGFFDIATGVGKTAVFIAIVNAANQIAQEKGDDLRSIIVVPTKVLLKQTAQSFNTFAPDASGHIGFYGDGHKNLKQPITLMTYNAWTDLSKEGKISAENVDILISDEAHRGTSEERIYISELFNGAVRLAFTASSEFDGDKAVYNSHKHEIYHKPLPEAVKDGELARYIQTQFHIVRAEPSQKLKDRFDGEIKGDAKRKLRQGAWTKWATRYYREGRDNVTGDLVSDNQAGFFVDDTTHANALEKSLNQDEELAQIAKDRGYDAVAVAVHSKVKSKKEQEKRLEDYKAGKYMAIIGDEMLKEGFDHDRMKTVVDWPHGSLVDKVQILGRGARKWFNLDKDRFEGLVFADTIVYVGSDDPEEDELERARALRNAILASDVLDDVHVFAPDFDEDDERMRLGHGGGYVATFEDDPDVEEYTTLEQIKTLLGERSKLRREHLVDVTKEELKALQTQKERTGLGGHALFPLIESPLEEMNASNITNIIDGSKGAAPKGWVTFILGAYEQQPDNANEFIPREKFQKLKDECERTGLGGQAILARMKSPPKGLDKAKIFGIIKGTTANAPSAWIELILETYSQQPSKSTNKIDKFTKDKLKSEYERTLMGGQLLLKESSDIPKGLTQTAAHNIVSGKRVSAKKEHVDFILDALSKQPSRRTVANKEKEKLSLEEGRTGLSGHALFSRIADVPVGLTASRTSEIIKGRVDIVNEGWIECLLETYEQASSNNRELIDAQTAKKLQSEYERKKITQTDLFKAITNPPKGMKAHNVYEIVTGRSKTAPKGWVECILKALSEVEANQVNFMPITSKQRQKLKDEASRTAVGAVNILQYIEDAPDGMEKSKVKNIFKTQKNAPEGWVKLLLETYEKLPTVVTLSASIKKKFEDEAKRTGLGGAALFNTMSAPPDGMTKVQAKNIVSGQAKTALENYISAVSDAYAELPDKAL